MASNEKRSVRSACDQHDIVEYSKKHQVASTHYLSFKLVESIFRRMATVVKREVIKNIEKSFL